MTAPQTPSDPTRRDGRDVVLEATLAELAGIERPNFPPIPPLDKVIRTPIERTLTIDPACKVKARQSGRVMELREAMRLRDTPYIPIGGWGWTADREKLGTVEVDFTETIGRPGLPWASGYLVIEPNLNLRPVKARGLGTDVGIFWGLRTMPLIAMALYEWVSVLAGVQWRIEPTKLPKWADDTDRANHDKHTEYCERVWTGWTAPGAEHTLRDWLSEMTIYSLLCGFYLGELMGKRERWAIGSEVRDVLVPEIPEIRAPWSVAEWILQSEKPIGVTQTLHQSIGRADDQETIVVIPWEKLIHVTLLPTAGPTDLEGMSIVRAAYSSLEAIKHAIQCQALSIEINGVGHITITQDKDRPFTGGADGEKAKLIHHLMGLKAGHVPFTILPPGGGMEILSPQDSVPDMSPQIGLYERLALMSIRQAHQLIGTQGPGSFAARSSASADARDAYDYPALILGAHIERVFSRFLRLNFPDDERIWVPRVRYGSVEVRDNEKEARTLGALVTAGVVLPTPGLDRYFRDKNDWPQDRPDAAEDIDPDADTDDTETPPPPAEPDSEGIEGSPRDA